MNLFDQANDALQRDLVTYTQALRTIVSALPSARALCAQVVKETRLLQALLAFADGPQVADLTQVVFQLSNRWPDRERPYARTHGFAEEIAEARQYRAAALVALRQVEQLGEQIPREISACFTNIAGYLDQERRLLEECHATIQPHAAHMAMTYKQLNLLHAAAAARLPSGVAQHALVHAYEEMASVLQDWQGGVPLDERGVAILAHCVALLPQADTASFTVLMPSPVQRMPMTNAAVP
jgi:hypothetical protein